MRHVLPHRVGNDAVKAVVLKGILLRHVPEGEPHLVARELRPGAVLAHVDPVCTGAVVVADDEHFVPAAAADLEHRRVAEVDIGVRPGDPATGRLLHRLGCRGPRRLDDPPGGVLLVQAVQQVHVHAFRACARLVQRPNHLHAGVRLRERCPHRVLGEPGCALQPRAGHGAVRTHLRLAVRARLGYGRLRLARHLAGDQSTRSDDKVVGGAVARSRQAADPAAHCRRGRSLEFRGGGRHGQQT